MKLTNILQQLKLAAAKRAEEKISSMIKNIPLQAAKATPEGPKSAVPKPAAVPKPMKPATPKINTPNTYAGGIDLMAPSVSGAGNLTSPGQAWADKLGG